MTKFTPEYIALCREVKLPHRIQPGDWCAIYNPTHQHGAKTALYLESGARFGNTPAQLDEPKRYLFWLPQEGDLLDLLEVESVDDVSVRHLAEGGYEVLPWSGDPVIALAHGKGPDRKTALLRLLLAVRPADPVSQREKP